MLLKYTIRPILLDYDLDSIYSVMSDPTEQHNLNTVVNTNTKERYKDLLSERLHSTYEDFKIIEVGDEFSGFVAAYDMQEHNHHVMALIYIAKKYRNGSLGLVGIQYMNWLFRHYDIFKVYTEVYSYNLNSIKYHKHFGFVEEGRLEGYRYFCGKYWDVIYYSMSKDAFFNKYNSIINRFKD